MVRASRVDMVRAETIFDLRRLNHPQRLKRPELRRVHHMLGFLCRCGLNARTGSPHRDPFCKIVDDAIWQSAVRRNFAGLVAQIFQRQTGVWFTRHNLPRRGRLVNESPPF